MGGTITTKLASLNFNSVDVLVTAHPGQLNLNDFKMINKPYALICSQGSSTLSFFQNCLCSFI